MIISVILLIIALGIILYSALAGGKDYPKMQSGKNTTVRQKIYKSWIRESWLLFGLTSIAGLAILNGFGPYIGAPDTWLPLNDTVRSISWGGSIGTIVVLVITILLTKQQAKTMPKPKLAELKKTIEKSDSGGLIAQNSKERALAGHLSLAAGINEELFYRIFLPVVIVGSLGAQFAVAALAVSVILFGITHQYQGIGGVMSTSIAGAILMFLYLGTGSILIVILIHVLIDFRSTVGLSWVLGGSKPSA